MNMPLKKEKVIKESTKLIAFTAGTRLPAGKQGDRREGIIFDLSREVLGANQKFSVFHAYLWPQARGFWRIGLSAILQKNTYS
jgi:hypothetical protein